MVQKKNRFNHYDIAWNYRFTNMQAALGLKYKKKQCGSFGGISILSFYANKHITTGEGGMLLTNNSSLNKKFKDYRNLFKVKV